MATISKLPFSLIKRKNRKFYYVSFKDLETGLYLPAVSTKKETESEAMIEAWKMFNAGMLKTENENQSEIEKRSRKQSFNKIVNSEISDNELEYLIELAKKRGIIKAVVKTNDKSNILATEFFLKFWNYEESEYVKEKLRKSHSITKRHCLRQLYSIKNYWNPFFENKVLGEITKQDVKKFVNSIALLDRNPATKNDIIRAGTSALKYAFNNELIEKDITSGLVFFSVEHKEREILTKEIVQALFCVEWNDNRAKLANFLAMITGLRAGEILALRLKDLGKNCIYVNHSWSDIDGLKCPKNGEKRIAYIPSSFSFVIEELKKRGEENPFNRGLDSFIFYSTLPQKPIDEKILLKGLRIALEKIGMTKEETKKYTFHSWRHFFTSYMFGAVDNKILQKQTGHKTTVMLEHYGKHEITGDVELLENALETTFSEIFDTKAPKQIADFSKQKLDLETFKRLTSDLKQGTMKECVFRLLNYNSSFTWSMVKDVFNIKEGTFALFKKEWLESLKVDV